MELQKGFWFKPLLIGLLAASLALAGCSGDDGAQGPQGIQGVQGEPGPVTTTSESCNVCHGAGAIAPVENHVSTAKDVTITVNSVTNVSGKLQVAVNLKDSSNNPVTDTAFEARRLAFTLSDLVPAGTTTNATVGTWSTAYYKRWASENLTTAGAVADLTDAANGNYVFTFNTPVTTLGTAGADYADLSYTSATDHQRLIVEWRPLDSTLYNRAATAYDFDIPADTQVATELPAQRVLAPIDGCKKCHGDHMDKAAHASSHLDTRGCVTCHSPLYSAAMATEGIFLTPFIHKIHAAIDVEAFPTRINGNGYVDVTYPQNIKNCAVCHTGSDNMTDAWKTNPNGVACASCHTGNTLNADGSMSHDTTNYPTAPAGSYTDAVCSGCHPSSAIESAHAVTTLKNAPDVSITPVYTTTITLTGASGAGGEFLAGDTPVVTVSASDASGAMATADLTAARLYVYGPRSKALPILTPGSTTDPAWDPTTVPNQATNLLSTTDANVTIEATDIKYQLQAIPDTLENGTYMVMAYLTYPSSRQIPGAHPYNIDGWQLINFQVGTTTVQPRVAGDGCNKCHDLTDWTSTAHRAYFGTDGCLACHDQSGGHADTIANRVHAVHSASVNGDLGSIDWSEVTYPSSLTNCAACHNSTDTSYLAPSDANQPSQWAKPCIGCHGDTPGASDHMIQNGGPL